MVALVAVIFVLDLLTPRGVAMGAAYVCPVLLAFASPRRTLPVEVAAVATGLTLLNYHLSPDYVGAAWVVVVNRVLSVGMIWFVALLSLERRRVGAALRQAEARSAVVVEAAMDAILTVDAAGRVQGINPAGRRAFGVGGGDVRAASDLLPAWTAAGPPVVDGVVDTLGRRTDGTTFPVRLAVSRTTTGEGPAFVAIVHDASALRARGQSLALLLAHLPVEVLRVDAEGRVVERHGDALARLGLDPNDLLPRLAGDLARARAGEPAHTITDLDVRGRPLSLEHWLVLDAVCAPCALWFCLDVSERRRLERKMGVAAKLAALGELAGNIAHEVNNPIGIISAKARLLMTGREPLPERTRQELGKIAAQCDRVANLTRKLLSYVRPGDGARERLDLRDPARKALSLVAAKAQRQGVEVLDALEAPSPPVLGSAEELEQVFLNLLLNALDAMPQGGTLRVSGAPGPGRAAVTVSDTGTGMDAAALGRLFEPFFTTKADHGTGLGLHICRGIVEGHGGQIEVSSTPGGGSAFTVELPAADVTPRLAVAAATPGR
ncbi:MAG: ATP-binding protein [Planctomycetes bacterium]|nr:ATP-binding protein [Planctomycetota bacterium]